MTPASYSVGLDSSLLVPKFQKFTTSKIGFRMSIGAVARKPLPKSKDKSMTIHYLERVVTEPAS